MFRGSNLAARRLFKFAVLIMVLGAVLMGWRWDEFVYQAIRIAGLNDLPTNVYIEEPSQIPWSQVRWSVAIEDLRLN